MIGDGSTDEADSVSDAARAFRQRERILNGAMSRPAARVICNTEAALPAATAHNFNQVRIGKLRVRRMDLRASWHIVQFRHCSCLNRRRASASRLGDTPLIVPSS